MADPINPKRRLKSSTEPRDMDVVSQASAVYRE
jgi:hypothetical protein